MKEGRTDDVVIRNAVDELVGADSDQPGLLALDAIVGGSIQADEFFEHDIVVGDVVENRSGIAVAGGDEAMHAIAIEPPKRRIHRPPRQASSIRRTSNIPGWPR